MKKYKIILLLIFFLVVSTTFSSPVFAVGNEIPDNLDSVTLEDINDNAKKIIYESDETLFYPIEGKQVNRLAGQYPIYTRVRVEQSSSNGTTERANKLGTYSSIASTLLGFIKGVPAMAVSNILSVVGLAASSSTYVQARTYTSYVQFLKKGEARWSNSSSYSPYVYSGKRNHYKHVLGGRRSSTGQWTTKSYDYLSTPVKIDKGNFYDNSNNWFKEQAQQRLVTGNTLDDMPW